MNSTQPGQRPYKLSHKHIADAKKTACKTQNQPTCIIRPFKCLYFANVTKINVI